MILLKWWQVQGATQQLSVNINLLLGFFLYFFFLFWMLLGFWGGLFCWLFGVFWFAFFFFGTAGFFCTTVSLIKQLSLLCILSMSTKLRKHPEELEASKLLRPQMAHAGKKLSMRGRCLDMWKLNNLFIAENSNQIITLTCGILPQRESFVTTWKLSHWCFRAFIASYHLIMWLAGIPFRILCLLWIAAHS